MIGKKLFANAIKRANRSPLMAICSPKSILLLAVFIVFGFLVFSNNVNAPETSSGYTIIGNTVQWENSYGKLVVWPHTSHSLTSHIQYANITSKIAGGYDFAFEFDDAVQGNVYLWQNISHNVKVNDIGNITYYKDCPGIYNVNYGFINDTWGWCNYNNGTEIYWEHYFDWYNTNASGIRIFWNVTGIIGFHYENQYWYDWNDKTGLFEHTIYNGRHFYWIKNTNFQEDETKQVKWTYKTEINSNGKWQLWIKRSEDTIAEALTNNNYVKLDPWWNPDYTYRYEIQSNATGVYVLNVNDTYAQNIWTLNASSANGEIKYLYCKMSGCASGDVAISNTTDETAWENDTTRTGTNPTSVWGDDALGIYHMNEGGDALLKDSSVYGRDCVGISNSGNATSVAGQFGKGMDFESGTDDDYYECEDTDTYTTDMTIMAWIKAESLDTFKIIISKYGSTSFWLRINTDNKLYSSIPRETTLCSAITSAANSITIGTWYHVAVTTNSTYCSLYLNGTRVDITDDGVGNIVKNNVPFTIGAHPNDQDGFPFDGVIDEVRWYNRTLSENEILEHYYNGRNNLTSLGAEEETGIVSAGLAFVASTLDNNSYTANNYVEVNASSSENATTCSLEWDDGTPSNESMAVTNADDNTSCWLNMTSLSDGEYLYTVYGNLITIGINQTGQRNTTVDFTAPAVSITSPANGGTEYSTQFDLNYTANDTNLDSCWYSLDSGTNTTISGCLNATLNISYPGSHTIYVYANDSSGNLASDSSTFTIALFELSVYNATDNATIEDWHVYILNGSGASKTSFTNNNTLVFNITDIPIGGQVSMTVWKNGSGNNTYNFSNDGLIVISMERHLIADSFLVNIQSPLNNTAQAAGVAFTLDITLPLYADGNASIWYMLNETEPYTLGCSNCTSHSVSISFSYGNNNITALINDTTHYSGVDNENKTIEFATYNSKYNISFFDELTNKTIDFSANKNGTLQFFCTDMTIDETITGTLNEYVVNCSGTLNEIKFTLFDPKNTHFRSLIPDERTGNLTFYMINTTPATTKVNKVTFLITDASLKYKNGIIHLKKIILGEGLKDIIDTRIGGDGNAEAHLIANELYKLSVESEDGTYSKSIGDYTAPDDTSTDQGLTIIDITFIPVENFIGTDISWSMQFNVSMNRIYFYWNDLTGLTNSIKFWVFNATNMSAKTLMYYDSVTGSSNHLFQWTIANINDSYIGQFEVDHARYGNLTETRVLVQGGVWLPFLGDIGVQWYHFISVVILIFAGSIFTAKRAAMGAVFIAILAGIFIFLDWIPPFPGIDATVMDVAGVTLIAIAVLALLVKGRKRL